MLNAQLNKDTKIAFICSPRLGDTLISMVTINNLYRHGYQVDVYGDYADALREWFPWVKIMPALKVENYRPYLAMYKTILHMYEDEISRDLAARDSQAPHSVVMSHSALYKTRASLVDIQVMVCRELLGGASAEESVVGSVMKSATINIGKKGSAEKNIGVIVRDNNLQPLPGLVSRRFAQRVVMHPESYVAFKKWPKHKFIKLSQRLQQMGYEICFIVAPQERESWSDVVAYGIKFPQFASLSETAAFIYESGFFIGNDSGIGHLASNLGVPTVSIILRKSLARQWRPSWAIGEVVLPPEWVNPRPIKERFWQYFTSVNRVLKRFLVLRARVASFEAV
jgi:heptosyltransferase III